MFGLPLLRVGILEHEKSEKTRLTRKEPMLKWK